MAISMTADEQSQLNLLTSNAMHNKIQIRILSLKNHRVCKTKHWSYFFPKFALLFEECFIKTIFISASEKMPNLNWARIARPCARGLQHKLSFVCANERFGHVRSPDCEGTNDLKTCSRL